MIKKAILKLLKRDHPWRDIGFDELSEIYINQLIRSIALSTTSIFVPVYLYRSGLPIQSIFFFYACWMSVRPFTDVFSAYFIGWFGPKKAIITSTVLHCFYLSLLLLRVKYSIPLALIGGIGSFAFGMHFLAIATDFSRVKHQKHGGKELSYLSICEKIGGVVGPLLGGLLAAYFGPWASIAVAVILLVLSFIPLIMTPEAVRTRQHITFKGLAYKKHIRDYLSWAPTVIENQISVTIWPLYVAVFVFVGNPYARLGGLAAVSTLVALVASRYIGRLIDKKRGLHMLRVGISLNAVVHIVRLFVSSTSQVLGINIVNESVTALYRLPYFKGLYDSADSLPGYRIAYFASLSITGSFVGTMFWITLWAYSYMYDVRTVTAGTFVVAAIMSMGIGLEKFKALRNKVQ